MENYLILIFLFVAFAAAFFYIELKKISEAYVYLLLLSFVFPLRLAIGPAEIYTFDFPLLAIFLRWLVLGRNKNVHKNDVVFFVLAFLFLISSGTSSWKLESVFDSFAIVRAISVYMVFRRVSVSPVVVSRVVKIIIVLAFFESVLSISQYVTGMYIGSPSSFLGGAEELARFAGDESLFRVRGTFGYDTHLGMFFIITIPVLFFSWFETRKISILAILLLSFLALVLTFTRTAWFSTIFSLSVLVLLQVCGNNWSRGKIFRLLAWGSVIILPLGVIFGGALMDLIFLRLFGEGASETVDVRFVLNAIAFDLIYSHLLFGVGFGNFGPLLIEHYGLNGLTTDIIKAHNVFIAVLCEAGLMAFLVFLVFLVRPMLAVVQNLKYSPAKSIVALACVMGVILQNVAAWTMLNPGVAVMFWAVFGFLYECRKTKHEL